MEFTKNEEKNILRTQIILGFIAGIFVIIWLVFLFGHDIHYKREGLITSYSAIDTTYSQIDSTRISRISFVYKYKDKHGDTVVQKSQDMDMESEEMVYKYDFKYFYSYRWWTFSLIWFAFAALAVAGFFIYVCSD